MGKIVLEIPDEILISLKEMAAEFAQDMRMLTAVKLYQMGRLSSGRAAQLAGVSRVSFLQSLARYGAPIFDFTEEELRQDMKNA